MLNLSHTPGSILTNNHHNNNSQHQNINKYQTTTPTTTLSSSSSGSFPLTPANAHVDLDDPQVYRPLSFEHHAGVLWPLATIQGYATKHMPQAFSFTKTRKRRYVLLLDRMLYTFKNDVPKADFREFFELTKTTNVVVTDQFPGVSYLLEIHRQEDGRTWYLQLDDVESMKAWLDRLKKTVQWLRSDLPGVVNLDQLISDPSDPSAFTKRPHIRPPTAVPPQLPPPTMSLPPPPPEYSN